MKAQLACPVFTVADVNRALGFYEGVLGFTKEFAQGDYVGVRRDGVLIHLNGTSGANRGPGTVYLECDEVDAYSRQVKAAGGTLTWEPQDYPFGRRDFGVQDPDGNTLYFSCAI